MKYLIQHLFPILYILPTDTCTAAFSGCKVLLCVSALSPAVSILHASGTRAEAAPHTADRATKRRLYHYWRRLYHYCHYWRRLYHYYHYC